MKSLLKKDSNLSKEHRTFKGFLATIAYMYNPRAY
jgi:hypothetical protein